MEKLPKVSVVVPTYNYGHLIADAIESVLAQTFSDFELVIVDDNSKDNTEEVVRRYAHDPRIRYIKNLEDPGMSNNFTRCLYAANGEYIKFLNSDDKFDPTLLEKFVNIMDNYPTVSLVTTNMKIFGIENRIFELPYSGFQPGKKVITEMLFSFNWVGAPTSVMLRRSNREKCGRFLENASWLPDWDMWCKHLTVGDCYIIPEPLVHIRTHPDQATVTLTKNYTRRIEEYYFYKAAYEENKYQLEVVPPEFKRILKKKAKECATVLYHPFQSLKDRNSREIFAKAFNIAVKERALFDPVLYMIKS